MLTGSATMTMEPLTQERRRQLTREHLLAAAAQVFAERGFHGATLDEVARVAGFTKGAVYSNFASKDDLFLALFKANYEREMEGLVSILGSSARAARRPSRRLRRPDPKGERPDVRHLAPQPGVLALRRPEPRGAGAAGGHRRGGDPAHWPTSCRASAGTKGSSRWTTPCGRPA